MLWIYAAFVGFILLMLVLDLKVVNRHAHEIRPRESLLFTGFTVLLALGFSVCVYVMYERGWPEGIGTTLAETMKPGVVEKSGGLPGGPQGGGGLGFEAAVIFLTAWVLEYSLSVDNIFVIAVIFSYFAVPAKYQHRVLFWGILGALVMRGMMIAAGAALVNQFAWIEYVFGGFLLFTAWKMLKSGEENSDPGESIVVRAARRFVPITSRYFDERFFVRTTEAEANGEAGDGERAAGGTGGGRLRLYATPLFLVLLTVEFTDVIFAVDSIPAVFSVTKDPFLVFTSNVFAILGLRSLFFAVAAAIGAFRYLKVSLVFVLGFVGMKMLAPGIAKALMGLAEGGVGWAGAMVEQFALSREHDLHIPPLWSLTTILTMLLGGVVASLFASAKERRRRRSPMHDIVDAVEVTRRNFKRMLILIAGSVIVLVGVVFVGPLPGPGGVLVAGLGLGLLATEFVWAQKLLKRLKDQTAAAADRTEAVARHTPVWLAVLVVIGYLGVVAWVAHGGVVGPWISGLMGLKAFKPVMIWMMAIGPMVPIGFWAYRTVMVHLPGRSARAGRDGRTE